MLPLSLTSLSETYFVCFCFVFSLLPCPIYLSGFERESLLETLGPWVLSESGSHAKAQPILRARIFLVMCISRCAPLCARITTCHVFYSS